MPYRARKGDVFTFSLGELRRKFELPPKSLNVLAKILKKGQGEVKVVGFKGVGTRAIAFVQANHVMGRSMGKWSIPVEALKPLPKTKRGSVMSNLRNEVIKLANRKPELRNILLPILKEAVRPPQGNVWHGCQIQTIDESNPDRPKWKTVAQCDWTPNAVEAQMRKLPRNKEYWIQDPTGDRKMYEKGMRLVAQKKRGSVVQEGDICTVNKRAINWTGFAAPHQKKILNKTLRDGDGRVVVQSIQGDTAMVYSDPSGFILGSIQVPIASLTVVGKKASQAKRAGRPPDRDELYESYVIQDGHGLWYEVYYEGKKFGKYKYWPPMLATIQQDMERQGFFPSIYYVNDHGNTSLLDSKGRELDSWV